MSSIEERLFRDIAAVTGGVVVTESNLRHAREAVDERIDSQRQRNRRRALVAAAAAAVVIPIVGVVAFQALDSGGKTGQPVSPVPTSPSADGAAPGADYSVVGATDLQGPGSWALTATGDPDAPMAVFDVPAGFQARETFVWTDVGEGREFGRGFGQLTYWAPTRVLADPCNVDKPSPQLGPTVEDLAAALVSQQRTTTTEPVPVELDGHRGLYLELRTPAACEPGEGFLIWEAGESGDGRILDVGTWTDRYWILDVGGQRVVVTALTVRGAVSDVVELVTGVAKTTSFVAPE